MAGLDLMALEAVAEALPQTHRGPGGVVGVVHNGQVVFSTAWGHADLTRRTPMTGALRMPVCSVSKQFTCGVVLAEVGSPEALDPLLPGLLPQFKGPLPRVRDLCNNQSGLRDYWSLSVLQGGLAEQQFPRDAAVPLIARNRTGHFAPGSHYSYSNGNFRMVAELIERATGQDFGDLCRKHLWGPAGMTGAYLAADTRQPPDGVIGYEGSAATGFVPADNGVWWMGDAGMAASLNDLLAWEQFIDATRDDPDSIYRRMSEPQSFGDGSPAGYGFGLHRSHLGGGYILTGHGGALRGYRCYRMHVAAARLSVVVMFNHHADAQGAALTLARAALGLPQPKLAPVTQDWTGTWICESTGLSARLEHEGAGVRLHFATGPEMLGDLGDGRIGAGQVVIARDGAGLHMLREAEHLACRLHPLAPATRDMAQGLTGRWYAAELDAHLVIEANGPGLAVWFDGMLGQGRVEPMHPIGQDTWIVATRRSMDAPAPGDWTLRASRDGNGTITGLRLGCWLARGIDYTRGEAA